MPLLIVYTNKCDRVCELRNNHNKPENPTPYSILNDLRVKNLHRLIFAHININSILNKFDMLADLIVGKVGLLLISETKIDDTFPSAQFQISGFSTPFRLDRTQNGGGIMLYVREDIPAKRIHSNIISENFECFFVEINLYKKKWLIVSTYNPCRRIISSHLDTLRKCMDHFLTHYENFVIMGDFNSEPTDDEMQEFCNLFNSKKLVKEPTCYKNPEKPSCIDLILTNRHKSFQNSAIVEVGLSDFHKMTVAVLKTYFKKNNPTIISYRDYKHFSNFDFRAELDHTLFNHHSIYVMPNDDFVAIFMDILERHAPIKYKYVGANEGPFMNKEIRKAIMLRSHLLNIFNKEKTVSARVAYKIQRNICTNLLRNAKLH